MHSRALRFAVALSLVIAVCAASVWFLLRSTVGEVRSTAAQFAEAVKNTFHFTPKVTVDRVIILQEHAPALELVTTKRRFQHKMQWSSTRFGSTKEMALDGDFTANVGFDLREPFAVDFDSRTGVVRITHPRPKLLSVQMESIRTTQEEGWWNSITDADRSTVLTAFTADARASLETNKEALDNARADLRKQLTELLGKSGLKVEFNESAPAPTPLP